MAAVLFVGAGNWRMVEGHQVHRVAIMHRKKLVSRAFAASSPNGKFAEGASLIDGQVLRRIEAHGKNLFYFFDKRGLNAGGHNPSSSPEVVVVHIHFGMSGQFRLHGPPGPAPGPNTRLQLIDPSVTAHLSAMTCQHGGIELYEKKCHELGPDPLREDADAEEFWNKLQKTSKSIGVMLMDQSAIAGVGNIYRAEILFRAGIHPEVPAKSISRKQFELIWYESVQLLQRGVKTGSILTVDPAEKLPRPWTRRYIYNHSTCPRCRGVIRSWDMAGRTAYACDVCQPLGDAVSSISSDRKKAIERSQQHEQFVSHCAPEPVDKSLSQLRQALRAAGLSTVGDKKQLMDRLEGIEKVSESGDPPVLSSELLAQKTVGELRSMLRAAGLQSSGKKSDLLERLIASQATEKESISDVLPEDDLKLSLEAEENATWKDMTVAELRGKLKEAGLSTSGRKAELITRLQQIPREASTKTDESNLLDVKVGTAHLGEIRSATQAAMDKRQAGESAAVEHVGIVDFLNEDDTKVEQSRLGFRTRKRIRNTEAKNDKENNSRTSRRTGAKS